MDLCVPAQVWLDHYVPRKRRGLARKAPAMTMTRTQTMFANCNLFEDVREDVDGLGTLSAIAFRGDRVIMVRVAQDGSIALHVRADLCSDAVLVATVDDWPFAMVMAQAMICS